MGRKYKHLLTLMTISHKIANTSAYPTDLPSFIYTDAPTTNTPYGVHDIHLHIHNYSAFLILIIACLAFCIFLYKQLNRRQRPTLMLEITNGRDCVTCFAMYLPLCIKSCHFHATAPVHIIEMTKSLRPCLIIDWGNFEIITNMAQNALSLPSTIRITPWTAYKLSKILNNTSKPHITQLWASHHNFCIPIDVCSSECSLCPEDAANE